MEFSFINLLAVLLVAWVAGNLFKRWGYPSVLGELLAGMVLGPPLLGLLQSDPGLEVLAKVGVFLMMLYVGLKIDHNDLMKSSWSGFMAALGGFVIPFGAGYWLTEFMGHSHMEALFVGLAMAVTSLATKSRILVDLKLIGTRIANVLISASLICDTAALLVFTAIMSVGTQAGFDISSVGIITLKVLVFFALTIFVGIKFFPNLTRLTNKLGFEGRTANFTLLLLIGIVFAEAAELAGLHSILGAFMAGLFIHEGVIHKRLSSQINDLVHDMSIGFLAPIFFVTAGFHVSFEIFYTHTLFLTLVVVVATVTNILGTALFYRFTGRSWPEGITIGAGMNGRGAVEIIIAEIALQAGLIDRDIFSILVFTAIITTATVPVLLRMCVSWLERRGELETAR